mmetsp:Transcript_50700/g.131824  ORF Transcript_50700/g.131824 Transcript_50700/m.131824 type:complete len:204 (+) Transcript_50700:1110-1721(+)
MRLRRSPAIVASVSRMRREAFCRATSTCWCSICSLSASCRRCRSCTSASSLRALASPSKARRSCWRARRPSSSCAQACFRASLLLLSLSRTACCSSSSRRCSASRRSRSAAAAALSSSWLSSMRLTSSDTLRRCSSTSLVSDDSLISSSRVLFSLSSSCRSRAPRSRPLSASRRLPMRSTSITEDCTCSTSLDSCCSPPWALR